MEKRVVFTVGVDDVRPLSAAADAFVLPTLYEPLSNAVLEALACGLPCVVSTQCGAAELVTPGVNGAICDPLLNDQLVQALTQVVAGAAGMRAAARAAVAGRHRRGGLRARGHRCAICRDGGDR